MADRIAHGKARFEDQREFSFVGEPRGVRCRDQAFGDSGLRHVRGIDAAAVVGDFNEDGVAAARGRQADRAALGLAESEAFVRRFETMIDGVAQR